MFNYKMKILSTDFFFYTISFSLIITSIAVVYVAHSVYSLLFLTLCFILSSILLLILECEFLALIFVLIYVGAIAVLFLFSAMMLEAKAIVLKKNTLKHLPFTLVYFFVFLIPIWNIIKKKFGFYTMTEEIINMYKNPTIDWYQTIDYTDDITAYGHLIYSYYVVQFLMTGLILLLVTLCIVHLTTSNVKTAKKQNIEKQLSRKARIFK